MHHAQTVRKMDGIGKTASCTTCVQSSYKDLAQCTTHADRRLQVQEEAEGISKDRHSSNTVIHCCRDRTGSRIGAPPPRRCRRTTTRVLSLRPSRALSGAPASSCRPANQSSAAPGSRAAAPWRTGCPVMPAALRSMADAWPLDE